MKKFLFFPIFFIAATLAYSQETLMKELEQTNKTDTDYAFMTFKGTRLINGHTIQTKPARTLEFIFAHRFGPVNGGAFELWGLDDAQVRLGLDYGVTDNLSLSIGRNSFDKTIDGYAKYRLARQSKGARNFPVTITGLAGIAYRADVKKEDWPEGFDYIDRFAYVGQLLMARKFTPSLSLQLMPTLVHKNAVYQDREDNDQFAIGFGGRIKVTKSVALTSEYYYRVNPHENDIYRNALGFGIDIETGGHVFQLVMTNSTGLTERAFITETLGEFGDGDIHFGFNVTRTFQLKRKKSEE